MKKAIGRALFALLAGALLAPAAGAVEIHGRITTATTGKPAADVDVSLLALRQQPTPVRETSTDTNGNYSFTVDPEPSGRWLVQAAYGGVLYTQPAVLTSGDTITLDLEIYDSGATAKDLTLKADSILLQPTQDHLQVNEFFSVSNHSRPPRSYAPATGGSFQFTVPGPVGDLQASAGKPGGMPLRSQPQEVSPGSNQFYIDYALRPGETEIQVSYTLPLSGTSAEFKLPLRHPTEQRRLAVPSQGVTVEGKGIEELQQSQAPQVRVYSVNLKPPADLDLHLTFDPQALAAAAASQPESGGESSAASEGGVTIVPHPVNDAEWYIVGLLLIVLSLGLYYLYTLGANPSADKAAARPANRHRS